MTAAPCLYKNPLGRRCWTSLQHSSGGKTYLLIQPENSGTALDTDALGSASGDVNVQIRGSGSATAYLRLCHGQGQGSVFCSPTDSSAKIFPQLWFLQHAFIQLPSLLLWLFHMAPVWSHVKIPSLNAVLHEKNLNPAKNLHEYKVLCVLNALEKYDFIVYLMISVFNETM